MNREECLDIISSILNNQNFGEFYRHELIYNLVELYDEKLENKK